MSAAPTPASAPAAGGPAREPGSHPEPPSGLEAPPPPRSPWQHLYGAAHRARRAWYRDRARRLPRPVVSIGNLHWGGTGKTPVTAAVAAHLRDRGHRPCILSRGYGGGGGGPRLVSDGGPPRLTPAEAGDEPVLLAGELPGVAVVVGAERAAAGHFALAELSPPPDVFVLDDGFSHVRLARDLDLLVFPVTDPFAGGRLPPGGRLREPLASARWADAVLLTGLPPGAGGQGGAPELGEGVEGAPAPADRSPGDALAAALRPYGFRGPGFACALEAAPPRPVGGPPVPAGARVLLVSAIARPERFAATARRVCAGAGLTVAGHLALRDHHPYPAATLERIRRAAAEAGAAAVLTTAKDRVKLAGRLDLPLAEVPVRAVPEPAFREWLDRRLAPLLGAADPHRDRGAP